MFEFYLKNSLKFISFRLFFAITALLGMVVVNSFGKNWINMIYSVLTAFMFYSTLASACYSLGSKHTKATSEIDPDPKIGFSLGGVLSAISLIFVILLFVAQTGALNFRVVNAIARIWMGIFIAFLGEYSESFISPGFYIFIPIDCIVAGCFYILGMRNFDFLLFWNNLTRKK